MENDTKTLMLDALLEFPNKLTEGESDLFELFVLTVVEKIDNAEITATSFVNTCTWSINELVNKKEVKRDQATKLRHRIQNIAKQCLPKEMSDEVCSILKRENGS